MTDRKIYLDPPPHDWRTRRITVTNGRWFATITVDRDGYVDSRLEPGDHEIAADYEEAVKNLTGNAINRIWLSGYPHGFGYGSGPRYITTFAAYPDVDETIAALTTAEMDGAMTGLNAIADRLALPFDDWLRPGEHEIVRGVDFDGKPSALLALLRGKAKEAGLRLNGRAHSGGVWVDPRMSETGRLLRQTFPEKYADSPDRWTGAETNPQRWRPYVGGRDNSGSAGAKPVRWVDVSAPVDGSCPCGLRGAWDEYQTAEHDRHHLTWSVGVPIPKTLGWWRHNLAVVTTESASTWRKLAGKVARLPQRENHYDFSSWPVSEHPERSDDNKRAYLLRANDHVIGYLTASDRTRHVPWDLADGSKYGAEDTTLRPRIDLIWVAAIYRSNGVGGQLVEALAADFGCSVADVSWSSPVSSAGRRLARRISPDGIWVS